MAGTYIDLFGKTGDENDRTFYDGGTSLEVFSGTYHQVCGGYYNAQDQSGGNIQHYVTGDKVVKLYGGNFVAENIPSIQNHVGDNIRNRNYVVADSIDDDVNGGGAGKPAYSTVGNVSMLVQPMAGLTFVSPPAILLGIYSCSLYPGAGDNFTLDTRYYGQPIDMSHTDVASSPDGSGPNSYPVDQKDGNHTKVTMTINAPQTTLKSVWARAMCPANTTSYPATINLNDIGAVTEYVNGSERSINKRYESDDSTTLNIGKSVQLNGVRWFSAVNVAANAALHVNNFEMVLENNPTDATAKTELAKRAYIDNGFPKLNLAAGSSLTVANGGGRCTLGNVDMAVSTQLFLSCNNYTQNNTSGGLLFGKITSKATPPLVNIGLSPNSVPLADNLSYGFLYLGDNVTLANEKIGTIGNFRSVDGTVAEKANTTKQFLTIQPTTANPLELSSPSTAKMTYANFADIKTAIAASTFKNEVFKIRLLKPYPMTPADYTALSQIKQCAGLIITGWNGDAGFVRTGDGCITAGETEDTPEPVGTPDAGKNALHKNVAPSDSNGLTLLANDINLAVPTTFRNISLRSTVTSPISYKVMTDAAMTDGALQIGPGLAQDTASHMNIYGGKTTFSENDNYNTAVTIYNGKYATVLADVDAKATPQSNRGTAKLNIYGGTFGAGTVAQDKLIGITKGTAQHGGGTGRVSEIGIYPSASYTFHLNDSAVIGDAYGAAINRGSSHITIQNNDSTLFEHFPIVGPLHTTYTGAALSDGTTINIAAKNCTFGMVTPGNANETGPLLTGGAGAIVLNVTAAKQFDKIYGGGVPANAIGITPRVCDINFAPTCDTVVGAALSNWSTLTLQGDAKTGAKVLFNGDAGTFFAANSTQPVGTLTLQSNSVLHLKNPQNTYGINRLVGNNSTADCGTLLVNGTPSEPGLTLRGAFEQPQITIGLMPDALLQEGTKLLRFVTPTDAKKADYQKHTSIADCVVEDNTDAPFAGNGFVFLTLKGSVRVYPAPHNGAPGADPMRYTDYITLHDALVDMETYPAPKGNKYTVNFIRDYTIGYHNELGALVGAPGNRVTDDRKTLQAFHGAQVNAAAGEIEAIAFSSIDQNKPELLTENDMRKLNVVDFQQLGENTTLWLPENNALALHNPANEGITFESFKFGANCTQIAANGCVVTMGAFDAPNDQQGSVRMGAPVTLYGGSLPTITAAPASAKLVINSGTYTNIYAGSQNVAKQVTGNATIDINGGVCSLVSGIHTGGVATVNFNNTITTDTVTKFDEVVVKKNLTVKTEMSCYGAVADKANYAGNLTLADNAVLDFQNEAVGATFKAGKFTTGANAVLYVPKPDTALGVSTPLQVADAYQGSGTLITDVKAANRRVRGDDLILFATASPAPAKEKFFSTTMDIESKVTAAPASTIEYGLPNNPATRLAWVGMGAPETNAAASKTLYFDSMVYDEKNLDVNGAQVTKLFLLNKEQYDAFITSKTVPTSYVARTSTFTQKNNAAPAAPDGIGTGRHLHFYSTIPNVSIVPTQQYYTLTYAGEAWAIAVLDVYSPDTNAAGKTPKAVRNANKTRTLNIPLAEMSSGAHAPSGIYRIAWSGGKQFASAVTAPNRESIYPSGAFASMPTKGDWTQGASAAYKTTLQDVKPSLGGASSGNTAMYSMTVTTEQARSLSKVYLYVQDTLGNTREITVTPDWQFAADITYKAGVGAIADVVDANIEINSMATALPCPETFANADNAFAGWKVTKDASNTILNQMYYPTNKFKVKQDVELTAQWLPDGNKDNVPDAWQKKITFQIATADNANAAFEGNVQSIIQYLPQRKQDGTYTNGFDPAVADANKTITIAASDVPQAVPHSGFAFTMWTENDTGTTAVTPAGTTFTGDKTDKTYYAHFKSSTTGVPSITQTRVTHLDAPAASTASLTNKTLTFDFSITPMPGETVDTTQIASAFITQTPNWTVGTAEPADKKPMALVGGGFSGTVTADIKDTDIWYAYVLTNGVNGGKAASVILDTQAPNYTAASATGGIISQINETDKHTPASGTTETADITVSLTLTDAVRTESGYTASGLQKAGWSAVQLNAVQKKALCALGGFEDAASGVTKLPDGNLTPTFTVNTALTDSKIYLYTRDKLGNMLETAVPLTNVYNVSVPTWIGLAAIRGNTENKLIVPTNGCYIVNNSAMPVKAKITNFSIKSGAANHLTLVKDAPTAAAQMQLILQDKAVAPLFTPTPVAGINTTPLTLGTMAANNPTTPHGVGFTFTAKYLPDIPLRLSDWDLFTMSYQFTAK
ncbi:MAG: hypothetical protein RSF73_07250 [Ruthenibacterium sp.]